MRSPKVPASRSFARRPIGGVIRAGQRLGASEIPDIVSTDFDLVTAQANIRFAGQQLSYIFGRETHAIHRQIISDVGNLLIGDGNVFEGFENAGVTTHEVRLASNNGPGKMFDYTVGYFRYRNSGLSVDTLDAVYNPGAFGNPFASPPDPTILDRTYVTSGSFFPDVPRKEDSIYATVTFRPTPRTEITLGGRKLWTKSEGFLNFITVSPLRLVVSVFGFNTNVDAISKGFSINAAFQATPRWLINLGVNYAKAKIDNDTLPCRDGNFDGAEDLLTPTVQDFINNGIYVATCKSNATVTREPYWNAVLQSEYEHPLGSVNGYVRGLLNYNSSNSRRSPGLKVQDYALLNLYAGVRDPDGTWDVGLFVRNAANAGVLLSRALDDRAQGSTAAGFFGLSGYRAVSYTPPRQFGLQARFAFGSR